MFAVKDPHGYFQCIGDTHNKTIRAFAKLHRMWEGGNPYTWEVNKFWDDYKDKDWTIVPVEIVPIHDGRNVVREIKKEKEKQ